MTSFGKHRIEDLRHPPAKELWSFFISIKLTKPHWSSYVEFVLKYELKICSNPGCTQTWGCEEGCSFRVSYVNTLKTFVVDIKNLKAFLDYKGKDYDAVCLSTESHQKLVKVVKRPLPYTFDADLLPGLGAGRDHFDARCFCEPKYSRGRPCRHHGSETEMNFGKTQLKCFGDSEDFRTSQFTSETAETITLTFVDDAKSLITPSSLQRSTELNPVNTYFPLDTNGEIMHSHEVNALPDNIAKGPGSNQDATLKQTNTSNLVADTDQSMDPKAVSETQKKLAFTQQQSAASVKSLEERHLKEVRALVQQHHGSLRKVLKFLKLLHGGNRRKMEALDKKHEREMEELEEQNKE
jgi:hypothetical protein